MVLGQQCHSDMHTVHPGDTQTPKGGWEHVTPRLGTEHSFHWNWITPETLRLFHGIRRFNQHVTDFIHSEKLDGAIRTSVRHPTCSWSLSMGRNQQDYKDVFIEWKQREKDS